MGLAASEERGSGRSGTTEASLRQRWAAYAAARLMDGAWCASRWSAGRSLHFRSRRREGAGGQPGPPPPRRADLSLPPAARSCPSRPSFPLPVPAMHPLSTVYPCLPRVRLPRGPTRFSSPSACVSPPSCAGVIPAPGRRPNPPQSPNADPAHPRGRRHASPSSGATGCVQVQEHGLSSAPAPGSRNVVVGLPFVDPLPARTTTRFWVPRAVAPPARCAAGQGG